ncbi:hypothetical protein PG996_011527 [Apiospora saccharicola]|uniref:Uncharacterized protein n=1 Tax=Apiospora saccharicola TaxID=335842 RepID=A0ABR1UHN4_9PEZI
MKISSIKEKKVVKRTSRLHVRRCGLDAADGSAITRPASLPSPYLAGIKVAAIRTNGATAHYFADARSEACI